MRRSPLVRLLPLAASLLPACSWPSPLPPRPNVILVVVDDLGWADLSCQGTTRWRTPHLDRLAREGLRFADGYAAGAVCSPSRAALLTGRAPARLGITDWIRARFQRPGGATPAANPVDYETEGDRPLACPPNPFWLDLDEVTIAELLRPLGYATAHIGKWHLGDDAWYPQHQGFDLNLGGCDFGQPPSYFDPYRTDALRGGIPGLPPRTPGEYLTDREAAEAVAFIERHRDRPFFLHLAHYAVHTPIQAPEELTRAMAAATGLAGRQAAYAAMVRRVDDALGALLAALDRLELADNTLIVFTSDNGGLLPVTDNAPLRSGKGFAYEGGIRVPLLARWPAVIAAGGVTAEPAISTDWLPTIADATGAPLPARPLDGASLLPLLRDPAAVLPPRDLVWHFPHYRGDQEPFSILRRGPWKLIQRWQGPSWELFDLAADPGEARDLAAAQPDRVRELAAALAAQLTAMGARLPRPR